MGDIKIDPKAFDKPVARIIEASEKSRAIMESLLTASIALGSGRLGELQAAMEPPEIPDEERLERAYADLIDSSISHVAKTYGISEGRLTGSVEFGYCGARAGQTVTDGPGEGDTYTGNWRKTVAGIMWQCDGGEWIQGEYPEYYGGVE